MMSWLCVQTLIYAKTTLRAHWSANIAQSHAFGAHSLLVALPAHLALATTTRWSKRLVQRDAELKTRNETRQWDIVLMHARILIRAQHFNTRKISELAYSPQKRPRRIAFIQTLISETPRVLSVSNVREDHSDLRRTISVVGWNMSMVG